MLITICSLSDARAAPAKTSKKRSNLLRILEQRSKIGNKAINFAQVFAATFFRSQLTLPHHDGKVADAMNFLAGKFLDRSVTTDRPGGDNEIVLEPLGVITRSGAELAPQKF